MKTLSVIVPAYNCSQTISDCIQSIMRGSLIPNEIIIVDDCSSDDTRTVIEGLAKKNTLIKYVKTVANAGPATARNLGVKKSNSEHIFFLDSDTKVGFGSIEFYSKNSSNLDAIVGIYEKEPINKNNICAWFKSLFYFSFLSKNKLVKYDQFSASCAGIKKKVFNDLGGYDQWFRPGCDLENEEFGYRLYDNGYKIVLSREVTAGHIFPGFLKMTKTFFFRTSLWVEMFCARKKFSSTGGTSSNGLSFILLTISCFCLFLGIFYDVFIIVGFLLSIPFLLNNINFYKLVILEYPLKFPMIFFLSIFFAICISFGALFGFVKVLNNKSEIFKRFKR